MILPFQAFLTAEAIFSTDRRDQGTPDLTALVTPEG
jgi:hypothetical protein